MSCHVTDLLVVDLRSSLAYFMMTHPLPIADKLPIKTSVARQLPTYTHTCTHTHTHTHTHTYDTSWDVNKVEPFVNGVALKKAGW